MDARFVDWLENAKRRGDAMLELTPYAPKGYTLKPLAASAPEWLEQTRYPVQDPPNLITLLPRQRRTVPHFRAFHGKDAA